MNKVTRTLFRSFLRWNRQRELIGNPFWIFPKTLGIDHMLPLGVLINSNEAAQAAVFHIFRNTSYSPKNVDLALNILKKLNELGSDLKKGLEKQKHTTDEKLNRFVKFRVGQVLVHTETNVRGVVAGWEVDEAKRSQIIHFLPDDDDFNRYLTATSKLAVHLDSKEFHELTDPLLKRIHNSELIKYFPFYDETVGRYTPHDVIAFLYPLDVLDVPYRKSLLSDEGGKSAARLYAEARDIIVEMRNVLIHHFPHFVSPPKPSTDDAAATDAQHRREEIAKQLLADIFNILEEYRDGVNTIPPAFAQSIRRGGDLWSAAATSVTCSAEAIRDLHRSFRNEDNAVYVYAMALGKVLDNLDQTLQLRFQSKGLAYSYVLALHPPPAPPITSSSTTVEEPSKPSSQIVAVPLVSQAQQLLESTANPPMQFTVGQVVRHRLYGYRAVVSGCEVRLSAPSSKLEGVDKLSLALEQPYYRVLPDLGDLEKMIGSKIKRVAFSVPQQNLQAVTSVSQCIVDHPAISTFFLGYNANTGRYDTPHHLRYCFPSGHHALPVDYPQTTILDKWRQAVATNEVASLSDEQRAVMEDEIATYEKVDRVLLELRGVLQRRLAAFVNPRDDDQNTRLRDLLTLLKEAPSAKMSTAVDKLLWYANSIGHSADAKVCMKIGLAEFLRATPTMGLAAFQAAVDIDPEFTEAQSKLAGIYQYSKMSEQAMAHGMKAVVLMPKLYSTHMALGYVQHYTGHYDAATNSFRTALQLHPWAPDLVTTLQQMLNEQRAKTGNCAPNINTDPDKTTRPKRTKT